MFRSVAFIVLLVHALSVPAFAQCPPSCPVPGGGAEATDCYAEFAGRGIRNNFPLLDPDRPKPPKEVRCFDGDAACDLDGEVNHACRFDVDVCLHNQDPALPACALADVSEVKLAKNDDPELAALQSALDFLTPATSNVCTSGQSLTVPLAGPGKTGRYQRGKRTVHLKAITADKRDADVLRLVCVPRDWPSDDYDHGNVRSTPVETKLSPANAGQLIEKWRFSVTDGIGNRGVTATPTVGQGLVYIASWNGDVYGVKAETGKLKWIYRTYAAFPTGVQSSPTLSADGRLVVGDADGRLHCLSARSGRRLWSMLLGGPQDHFWASAQIVGNRVFIGTASHTDNPCAPGYFYALDLDTGAVIWSRRTVPDRICSTDTTVVCSTDADCGGAPNGCIEGCGAGVTATAAVSSDGATVYVATVGSYTFPSIAGSETVFALDASTGAVEWKFRATPGEQFADGPPYHDWGFVNGPMLVKGDDGAGRGRLLLVIAGKEGALYTIDASTGALVWSRALIAPPDFAGYGLFNGAMGWDTRQIFAALYSPRPSWPDTADHLFAFDGADGSTRWSAQIGASWGHIALANGLVFAGSNAAPSLYVHDAETGAQLAALPLPATSSSGPSIVDGRVYVGYGIFGGIGGVAAFALP